MSTSNNIQDPKAQYSIGDVIYTIDSNGLKNILRMPKPDLNGFCNNQFASHFLVGASNQCTQSVDTLKDCGDSMILDARAWTTNL